MTEAALATRRMKFKPSATRLTKGERSRMDAIFRGALLGADIEVDESGQRYVRIDWHGIDGNEQNIDAYRMEAPIGQDDRAGDFGLIAHARIPRQVIDSMFADAPTFREGEEMADVMRAALEHATRHGVGAPKRIAARRAQGSFKVSNVLAGQHGQCRAELDDFQPQVAPRPEEDEFVPRTSFRSGAPVAKKQPPARPTEVRSNWDASAPARKRGLDARIKARALAKIDDKKTRDILGVKDTSPRLFRPYGGRDRDEP
ncbi:hypothetical protein [uncultured Amaricoccus sp.]|uniref:hypothetical protein n=1 Tax=uncultured Amaricoccus sp. TaxID=339341 RepID=UPI002639E84C|nr:hypothetical protein [uncultured Amaricoccus sp.]